MKTEFNPFIDQPDEKETMKVQTKEGTITITKPLRTVEEKRELNRRQRAGESIPGRKKRDPKKTYYRSVMTTKDIEIMYFLAKFSYATTKTMSLLIDVKDAGRKLRSLKEWGYITNPTNNPTRTQIWILTGKGKSYITKPEINKSTGEVERDAYYKYRPASFSNNKITYSNLEHTLAISYTMACLASPRTNHIQKIIGQQIPLTLLVSEREILQALEAETAKTSTDRPATALRITIERSHTTAKAEAQMMTVYTNSKKQLTTHRPDAVIALQDCWIAIEVERTSKEALNRIITAFYEEKTPFHEVLYLTTSHQVLNKIRDYSGREDLKIRKTGKTPINFKAEPLPDHNGIPLVAPAWSL